MEIETLDWLRTSEGERLLVHASQAWADHPGDPVRVASVVRRLEPDAEKAAAATTQAQLRAKAVAKFGDRRARHVLHPGRARAGDPHPRGRPPRGAPRGRDPRRERHRPGLRDRRRPPRLRPGRADRGRDRPGPGAGGDGRGQPRRPRPGGRRAGRRRDHDRHRRVRRSLRRPGPPRWPRPGLRRGGLDAAVALGARPAGQPRRWSRSRPASGTTWCRPGSRRSGSATPARSRRRCCGRPASRPASAARR